MNQCQSWDNLDVKPNIANPCTELDVFMIEEKIGIKPIQFSKMIGAD